jgi:hypothetical protein
MIHRPTLRESRIARSVAALNVEPEVRSTFEESAGEQDIDLDRHDVAGWDLLLHPMCVPGPQRRIECVIESRCEARSQPLATQSLA